MGVSILLGEHLEISIVLEKSSLGLENGISFFFIGLPQLPLPYDDIHSLFPLLHESLVNSLSNTKDYYPLIFTKNSDSAFWPILKKTSKVGEHEMVGYIPLNRNKTQLFHSLKSHPIIFFLEIELVVASNVDRNSLLPNNKLFDDLFTQQHLINAL
eukprot:TRINITY_DN2928_c0_g1_i1.p1 TRINITY_DN2928_c0_g1~~TRINITY_DN2928_c0_g1_i1.p1  ORF type:complete len:156 (+),score=25.41 TRINITY_DN2928_c0_g1_i1:162-629(+)